MNYQLIDPDDLPPFWDPSWDDNLVIAEGPGGLQVIVSDERCCLWIVKDGELLREYASTSFSESDGPAIVGEVEALLEDAAEFEDTE